ncbi:MAG TPA: hypothetical protein VEO94_07315 [Candidatus Dormibacteraeota bacterium]|nr:hypothetical protein [Candidatus Dormibacteraeota bacterium]
MPTGPSTRIFLFHPDRPPSPSAIEWIVERQRHSRVLLPPVLLRHEALPARARHEPFAGPDPAAAGRAAQAAGLLAGTPPFSGLVAEAAALALVEDGAVLVSDREIFRDLIALSSWSMNVSERPSDGLLAQHIGIASRLPAAFRDTAGEAVAAILSGDADRTRRVVRARRLRARKDGPERFGRLGRKSAGLRPAVVYLDLLAAPAASGAPFAGWLRGLDTSAAEALLSVAAAVFI